jgi:hypothetical protein
MERCKLPSGAQGNPFPVRPRTLVGVQMKKLAIKDLAEQTGLAAGTIRMWEQRYGFPEPARTAAGYRVYTEQDVIALRRVVAYRTGGLSVPNHDCNIVDILTVFILDTKHNF